MHACVVSVYQALKKESLGMRLVPLVTALIALALHHTNISTHAFDHKFKYPA